MSCGREASVSRPLYHQHHARVRRRLVESRVGNIAALDAIFDDKPILRTQIGDMVAVSAVRGAAWVAGLDIVPSTRGRGPQVGGYIFIGRLTAMTEGSDSATCCYDHRGNVMQKKSDKRVSVE